MPAVVPIKDQQLNCRQLAVALGRSSAEGARPWLIYGVKKANAIFAKQGREKLIFTGRYSTPAKVGEWLETHPDFVANQVLAPVRKNSTRRDTPAHQPA